MFSSLQSSIRKKMKNVINVYDIKVQDGQLEPGGEWQCAVLASGVWTPDASPAGPQRKDVAERDDGGTLPSVHYRICRR